MNILYHHRTRARDGQRIHIDGMIAALRRASHDVLEVGPALEPEGGGTDRKPAGAWLRPLRELAEIAYNLLEWRKLRAAARRHQPQAQYSRHALFGFAPALLRGSLKAPWIVEVNAPLAQERAQHGGLFFERLARWLETRTLNAADRVVVVTRVMGDILVRQGVQPDKIEVHPNGIDPERLRFADGDHETVPELEGRVVLGFVGFVRDWNRLDRTYPCLQRHPEATLLVVGDGPDRARLIDEAAKVGVQSQLHFVGSVASSEVMRWVCRFDVALMPETTEYASPLKLLDYLAAGRAILGPDRPNLREVLEHDVDAKLFDPDQEEAFDRELEALLASADLRARLGKEARATLDRKQLSWDANARRLLKSVEELKGMAS